MTAFGGMLRELRKAKRFSQLDLALEADVSSRHISFLENGRSKPSREMIIHLANRMDIPLRETNMLLASAGYSHQYQETEISDPSLASVREALSFMLNSHEPYPAVVMDCEWNILMANQSQQRMTQRLIQLGAQFPPTFNMMELFMAEKGYRPFVENWEEVAIFSLQRIYKEHLLSTRRDEPNELLERLLKYPGIPDDWQTRNEGENKHPLVKVKLDIDGKRFSLFSTIATFGTALDVTLQDIRIEHYFPGDEEAKCYFEELSS